MDRGRIEIRPVIGLEIHVQLATRTKLFCACPLEYGGEPNSAVCPVCLGMPGVLPVMNERAFEYAVRTALALNCQIARYTKWDRKSYYYPDLPKNYQISQYDLPLGFDGAFDVPLREEEVAAAPRGGRPPPAAAATESTAYRRVRIRRAHLEEDAGKNLHEKPGITQVDLNRTGTPLLEIVTEPDLASADEAYAFCTQLQRLVQYLGVSQANMQKGQMRFEPNVNVVIDYDGREYKTPIAEVKNLNSFRSVRSAIEYEIQRQVSAWQADHEYVMGKAPKQNRGWDDDRGTTEFQRGKEEAHDYRYFPDPDLAPVIVKDEWLEAQREQVGELPLERESRLQKQYGLTAAEAATILSDRATADLFESAAVVGHPPTLAKQFTGFWQAKANEQNTTIAGLDVAAQLLGELSLKTAQGVLNSTAAQMAAERLLKSGRVIHLHIEEAIQFSDLVQVGDESQIQQWIEQVFSANRKAVEDASTNPKKQQQARSFLTGQVMKISGGKADPRVVQRAIEQRLAGDLKGS